MALRLGDEAPNFTAETTEGTINFYDYLGDSWGILFSHPKDFTPVCTTELGAVAKLKPEFDKRNVKVLGLSVDELGNHKGWADDIEETQGAKLNFPLISDTDRKVSDLYDMIHPNANDTLTVRSVFIIGADKKVKLIITYPASTGRNFDEILRVIDSLQLTAKYSVATPVNWKDGEDVIIAGAVSDEDAKSQVPEGLEGAEAVPADHAPAEQVTRPTAPRLGDSVADVLPGLAAEQQPVAGAGSLELREVVVRDVFGIDAHRAAAFDEVEAREVVDRRRPPRSRVHRVGDGRDLAQVEQRHVLRRRELDLARGARRERFVGRNHCSSSISEPSATSSPPSDRTDEEPRREPLRRALGRRPVREVDERVGVDVDAGFFLRLAHRGPARRARRGRRARRRSRRDRCDRPGTPTRRRGTRASTTGARAAPRARRRRRAAARRSRPARPSTPFAALRRTRRCGVAQSSCSMRSSPFSWRARSTFLSNLPTDVFGTSSMKLHRSGTCHLATCSPRYAASVGRVDVGARPCARRTRAGARPSAGRARR